LCKICLPEWEGRLTAKPELIYDDKTPFEMMVDSGTRTYRIPFNRPMAIIYADPKYIGDRSEYFSEKVATCKTAPVKKEDVIWVRDPKDLESTFNYLTGISGGISARQTDPFGIVPFDPENSIVRSYEELGLMDDLLSPDEEISRAAKDKLASVRVEALKRQKASFKSLLDMSEERIKRHLRHKHNNLMAQWQRNEEMKMGKYPPSLAERLGFKVLDPEIKAKDDMSVETARIANEMMARKVVG
jgi:hypothetical protein